MNLMVNDRVNCMRYVLPLQRYICPTSWLRFRYGLRFLWKNVLPFKVGGGTWRGCCAEFIIYKNFQIRCFWGLCYRQEKRTPKKSAPLFCLSMGYLNQHLALSFITTLVNPRSSANSSLTCAGDGSGNTFFRSLFLPMFTNRGLHCLIISTSSVLSNASKGSAVIIV